MRSVVNVHKCEAAASVPFLGKFMMLSYTGGVVWLSYAVERKCQLLYAYQTFSQTVLEFILYLISILIALLYNFGKYMLMMRHFPCLKITTLRSLSSSFVRTVGGRKALKFIQDIL